jgi:hypothetical protein
MSKTYKDSPKRKAARRGRERHISVRAVPRDPLDLRKLSRAAISMAMAEAAAEAEARAQNKGVDQSRTDPDSTGGSDV